MGNGLTKNGKKIIGWSTSSTSNTAEYKLGQVKPNLSKTSLTLYAVYERDVTKIAFVVNGTLGDKSFFDSGYEGVKKINSQLSDYFEATVIELTYNKSNWYSGLRSIVGKYDIVAVGTYDMKEHVIPLLEEFPNQKWWFYDEEWNFDTVEGWQYAPSDNLYAVTFANNEGSYVLGYMAAMLSESEKIAYMGGLDNTVLEDIFVGFANGAKAYNKDISVTCAWMNTFSDITMGEDVAKDLYDAGNDVVYAVGGNAALGCFDAVISEDEGNYAIGFDSNFGKYYDSLGTVEGNAKAERIVSCMEKDIGQWLYDTAKLEMNGKVPYGTNKVLGLKGGYIKYSITDTTKALFTTSQLSTIDTIANKIAEGKINPGTAYGHNYGWFSDYCDSVK